MVGYDSRKIAQNWTGGKQDFRGPLSTIFKPQDPKESQHLGGGTGLSKVAECTS
jgi:hypothetical protein